MSDSYKHLFVIGAQRAGSTMLYGLLDQHPDIEMAKPVRPEPKYFISNENTDYHAYLNKVFPERASATYLGEKSTSYYEIPRVADRIKSCIPDAKIIFIMRNPVLRALSNYRFSKQNGFENRSLREVFLGSTNAPALSNAQTSVNPFDYLGRGEYLRHIKHYFDVFGKEGVLPLVFEELTNGSDTQSIWEFLDIQPFRSSIQDSFRNQSTAEEVDSEVIEFLQNYFHRHNEALAGFLGLDLAFWDSNGINAGI